MAKLSKLNDALNAPEPRKPDESNAKLVAAVNEMAKSVNTLAAQVVVSSQEQERRIQTLIESVSGRESSEIQVNMDPPDMSPLVKAIESLEKIVKANNKSGNVDFEIERDAEGVMVGVRALS